MPSEWLTVQQCAERLDVPTEAVHHLVNCGLISYTINRELRTCVRLEQVSRALEANARSRLEGLKVEGEGL